MLKKSPSDELFVRRVFNYLPDSNSNFRPARINSEFRAHSTVATLSHGRCGILTGLSFFAASCAVSWCRLWSTRCWSPGSFLLTCSRIWYSAWLDSGTCTDVYGGFWNCWLFHVKWTRAPRAPRDRQSLGSHLAVSPAPLSGNCCCCDTTELGVDGKRIRVLQSFGLLQRGASRTQLKWALFIVEMRSSCAVASLMVALVSRMFSHTEQASHHRSVRPLSAAHDRCADTKCGSSLTTASSPFVTAHFLFGCSHQRLHERGVLASGDGTHAVRVFTARAVRCLMMASLPLATALFCCSGAHSTCGVKLDHGVASCVLAATCGTKLDRGVFAVGCGTVPLFETAVLTATCGTKLWVLVVFRPRRPGVVSRGVCQHN